MLQCQLGGEEGRFKKLREVGSLLGYPGQPGKLFLPGESGTAIPLLGPHKCCFCPLASRPRRRRQCFTQSLSQDSGVRRVLTTTSDVGNVPRGPRGSGSPGVAHRWLAACPEAWCRLFRGFTARAVCSGCFSNQAHAVGPRQGSWQCTAVGVCRIKALWWGLGKALQRVFVQPMPCGEGVAWHKAGHAQRAEGQAKQKMEV